MQTKAYKSPGFYSFAFSMTYTIIIDTTNLMISFIKYWSLWASGPLGETRRGEFRRQYLYTLATSFKEYLAS